MEFKIIFCAINNSEFIDCYEKYLKQFNNTEFYFGNFLDLENKFDCIISPGNSFGLFDGGIDGVINKFFSEIDEFIVHIQKQLIEMCGGYQQPGTCKLFTTGIKKCPYIAHTPTMGIPLAISDFSIIYHGMWSVLIEIHNHNKNNPTKKIKSILCPALGAGAGKVKPEIVYQLIKLALEDYNDFIDGKIYNTTHSRYLINWDTATIRYKKLFKLINSFDKTVNYDMYDLINLKKLQL